MSGTLRNARARWAQGIGTAICRMHKLAPGSYSRELRAGAFRGYDLRWFYRGRGESASCSIVATAYQMTLGGFDGKSRDESARA
jgi:hypothetical protein